MYDTKLVWSVVSKRIMDEVMEKIYYDPSHPGGLGGVGKLREAVKDCTGVTPTIPAVQKFLQRQDTYTLHKPALRNFPRNRVVVNGIDKQFQIDLVDMSEYSSENDNVRYLLTCIDVFSKYAWVRCLKNKTGAVVTNSFKEILHEGRIPHKVQTDEGKEFYNAAFQNLLEQYKIHHFSTSNETKASVVERFNRTFKTRMWRFLTSVNSRRYIDAIPDLVTAYNSSYHRSIKMPPSAVNKNNEKAVFINLYKLKPPAPAPFKFQVGDTVRISKHRGLFRKGYEQTFTDEFFTIVKLISRTPPVYKLKDISGDILTGTFYEAELQPVIIDENKKFKIEKVLTRKWVGRKRMALVKWLGWPEKFNSWVSEKDIVDIK